MGWSRETIYRKHRAGELSLASAEPPTIDPAEMIRLFGEPKPKLSQAVFPDGQDIVLGRH